ncbi:hypothetical protein J3A83DRAFT_4389781 [Scleroderma citrinum]
MTEKKSDIVRAYPTAVLEKQEQKTPGLNTGIKPRLKRKYAIVTGGDSGIGRATAHLFALKGLKGVTISYLPQEKKDAGDAAEEIAGDLIEVDLGGRLSQTCRFAHNCVAYVDILVNNASKQISVHMRSVFESNILQMITVLEFAIPHMVRGSATINTTSVVAYAGHPRLLDYASTKGAIVSFTRALSRQLAPRGIRVNMVAPGRVVIALQAASRSAEEMEDFGLGTPLRGRAAQPAEIAPAFVFLASSDANCMTGHCIHVNNGEHLGGS